MALRSKAKTDLLKSVPLFEHCSRRELGKIAGITDEIAVDDGKVLITEGDRGREFFVIISGEVDVRRKGRKLATLGPGTYFGEIALALAAAADRHRDRAHAAPRPRDRRPGRSSTSSTRCPSCGSRSPGHWRSELRPTSMAARAGAASRASRRDRPRSRPRSAARSRRGPRRPTGPRRRGRQRSRPRSTRSRRLSFTPGTTAPSATSRGCRSPSARTAIVRRADLHVDPAGRISAGDVERAEGAAQAAPSVVQARVRAFRAARTTTVS